MKRFILILTTSTMLGCSWVKPEPGAEQIVLVPPDRLSSECQSRGSVKVTALDKVGGLARFEHEVAEDLEALARNQAVKSNADTIVPITEIVEGSRTFGLYHCAGVRLESTQEADDTAEGAETQPYEY